MQINVYSLKKTIYGRVYYIVLFKIPLEFNNLWCLTSFGTNALDIAPLNCIYSSADIPKRLDTPFYMTTKLFADDFVNKQIELEKNIIVYLSNYPKGCLSFFASDLNADYICDIEIDNPKLQHGSLIKLKDNNAILKLDSFKGKHKIICTARNSRVFITKADKKDVERIIPTYFEINNELKNGIKKFYRSKMRREKKLQSNAEQVL